MSTHIERQRVAAARVGVGITKFGEDFVDKGDDPFVPGTDDRVRRVRSVPLGERAVGFFSDEIDQLIEQLRAWRDAVPRKRPKRAVPPEFHPSRHRRCDATA
jgi:hypothetical protein